VVPLIHANNLVRVTLRITGNRTWQLTLRANGDLTGGGQTISISNISWTATQSPPFQNGTLVANVEQSAAGQSGNFRGDADLDFAFQNHWTYQAASYSQTVTFTLSVL
jgi:hypothetical protein